MTYYTNAIKKKYQKEVFHDQKNDEKQHHEKKQFHNVITNVFFNDNNQFKYNLASYICQQNHDVMIFDNLVELRDYVLNYYEVVTRLIESKYYTRKINYIQHAKKHVYNFFSFFFMSYATIQILFFDYDLTSCLDTNENVSFCDRNLLSFNQNHSDLVHRIKSITITEIANMQVLNQYIDQKVLLSFNRISVFIKVYLMNNLQLDLIINMNVLNKNDIDFLLSRQALRVENIEILLCYTSPSFSINKSNCFIFSVNEYKEYENYYFYHFVADHTNNSDVTKQKTRK